MPVDMPHLTEILVRVIQQMLQSRMVRFVIFFNTLFDFAHTQLAIINEDTGSDITPDQPDAGLCAVGRVQCFRPWLGQDVGLNIINRLDTGNCHLNCSPVNDEPHVPFGGFKASGSGKHGGRWSLETFSETRWITLDRGGRPFPPMF